jgi:hypothetical protein
MDHRIAIWNVFHDGEITVAAHEQAQLEIFVSIPYLRARFSPLGDSFSLRLSGVHAFEFADYEGKMKTSSLSDIAMSGLEILSTYSISMPVKIATTRGIVTLDFDDLEIHLDTGQAVDYAAVDTACRQYWDEWSAKTPNA